MKTVLGKYSTSICKRTWFGSDIMVQKDKKGVNFDKNSKIVGVK